MKETWFTFISVNFKRLEFFIPHNITSMSIARAPFIPVLLLADLSY